MPAPRPKRALTRNPPPAGANGHGRGAAVNPHNRFERLELELEPEELAAGHRTKTIFFDDHSRSVISKNESPDIGFSRSLNPYRGCEHGCSYCYARPTHEYLGFSAGLDFETRIMVKKNAAGLLRDALSKPSWQPEALALSGVTDAYQPIERKLEITRACLEVLSEARNPVIVVTKNHLVTRDLDHLADLAGHRAALVMVSITSLDEKLAAILEPRASSPRRRLAALGKLRAAGVPCGVMIAPIIPAINDHEIPTILEAAAACGAERAGRVLLRLPHNLKGQFEGWLNAHFPDRAQRVLQRVREMRAGQLNDAQFGSRMRGVGPWADQLCDLFETTCRRLGMNTERCALSVDSFRRPQAGQPPASTQLRLF